jgi:predicted enzyme related to lactoylglutathione lyase
MGKPVTHWEVTGKDGKRLQKFYAELFDWKIDTNNPMEYGMVDTGGKGINGGIAAAQQGGPGGVTFYVEVDNLEEYLRTAERLGGKTLLPPSKVPGATPPVELAMFADPEGNRIGLVKAGTM